MLCYLITVMITVTPQNITCAGFSLDKDLGIRCEYQHKVYSKIKFKDSYAVDKVKGKRCLRVLKAKR